MYEISKRFTFDSAHALDRLPEGHKCRRLHGHTYAVEVRLSAGELDGAGMVVDFGELADLKVYLDGELDHRVLNEVLPFHTTSENLARHLWGWCRERWPQVSAVRVSETPQTWAEYRE